VILLARLAIDKSERGTGLGGDLFRDALLRSIASADSIGGRAVLVHAKHEEAAAFYRRHGFEPLPDNPMHLYRLMKDLRASLPQPKSN
jgi:GNAT superfamily N-acetyltransferase